MPEVFFSNRKMMDKQTFSSIQATTNTSRYAAAIFRKGLNYFWQLRASVSAGVFFVIVLFFLMFVWFSLFIFCVHWLLWTGELHITPLTGILQMRPSFSYLDKADGKTREREAANEGVYLCSSVYSAIFDVCHITEVLPCQQVAIPPRMKPRKKPKPSRWHFSHAFHWLAATSRWQRLLTRCPCPPAGEVCSPWVRAGAAEADPVLRVSSEETSGGALDTPAVPQCQGRRSTHSFPSISMKSKS